MFSQPQQLYYIVHCYYMGDPEEQERRLQEATQASLANLVRIYSLTPRLVPCLCLAGK